MYIFALDKHGSLHCLSAKCDIGGNPIRLDLEEEGEEEAETKTLPNKKEVKFTETNEKGRSFRQNAIRISNSSSRDRIKSSSLNRVQQEEEERRPVADLELDRLITSFELAAATTYSSKIYFCLCQDCCANKQDLIKLEESNRPKPKKMPSSSSSSSSIVCNDNFCLLANLKGQVGIFNYHNNNSDNDDDKHIKFADDRNLNEDEKVNNLFGGRLANAGICHLTIREGGGGEEEDEGKVYVLSGSRDGLITISNFNQSRHQQTSSSSSITSQPLLLIRPLDDDKTISCEKNEEFDEDEEDKTTKNRVKWWSAISCLQTRERIERGIRDEAELRRRRDLALTDADYELGMAAMLAEMKLDALKQNSRASIEQAKACVDLFREWIGNHDAKNRSVLSGRLG